MVRRRRRRRRKRRPKGNCFFCQESVRPDYKEPEVLRSFISETGRIKPRLMTGVCAKHQRMLAKEIKKARHLALLPFVRKI